MEDLRVSYDYSVRNNSDCIIQFKYGEDGMDACFVEDQSLIIIDMNTEEICRDITRFEKISYFANATETWSTKGVFKFLRSRG